MITNLVLIIFLAFIAYWWSSEGLFSALLHLLSVIIAGAMAFALWEPVTHLAMKHTAFAAYAWGVCLVVLFVFFLLVMRLLLDNFIGRNMHFPPMANTIGGALFGLFSGVLASGITVIGLCFLPVPPDFAGYQPLTILSDGKVEKNPNGGLWIDVDRMAAAFFSKLSCGAFYSRTPMCQYLPDLQHEAGLFRMGYDHRSSPVALPGTVSVSGVYWEKTPVQGLDAAQHKIIGDAVKAPGRKLVVVDTAWKSKLGTYDSDQTLRVSPPHIRLVTRPKDSPYADGELVAPIAAAKVSGNSRELIALADDRTFLAGTSQEDQFGFVFMIPDGDEPLFLLARRLRLSWPGEPVNDVDQVKLALGAPPGPARVSDDPNLARAGTPASTSGTVGLREGARTGSVATGIEVDNRIPRRFPISASPTSLKLTGDNAIVEGIADVAATGIHGTARGLVERIDHPSHMAIVRVTLDADRAQTFLGGAIAAAASLQGVWLEEDSGDHRYPIGYIWLRANGSQKISFDRNQPIRSSRDLPVREMGDGDAIHLYFLVPRGNRIVAYHVGSTKQDAVLTVPAQ